jgi:hypothetical protein
MIAFALAGLALAAPPTVEWAQPVHLAVGAPYHWVAGAPVRQDGWILQIRVDPQVLVPHQVGAQVLYAGPTPIAVVNADTAGGCAVGYVLGPYDPATTPVFVGSAQLPERVDAAAGAREAAAATATAHPPAVLAPSAALDDLRGIYAILAERVAACAPHETDVIATLRAQSGSAR